MDTDFDQEDIGPRCERERRIVRQAVMMLREHFDNVQIFCNSASPQIGTMVCSDGAGNHYARVGHVQRWLHQEMMTNRMA